MVSASIPPAGQLSGFFRGPIIEDLLEPVNRDDDEVDGVPTELVRFFRGAISQVRMRERLEDFELRMTTGGGNLLFSEEFSVRHLPQLFQHLLYRMGIVLNRVGTRYSALNSRQRMELRATLTDNRKNELNAICSAFQQYRMRYVSSSRELCFLLDMTIDVLNDVLYENE